MKEPTRRRIGRPTRKAANAKALQALLGQGIDPATIDPRRILAGIAADTSSPATARVQAAKALLAISTPDPADDLKSVDPVTRRAIELLAVSRTPH